MNHSTPQVTHRLRSAIQPKTHGLIKAHWSRLGRWSSSAASSKNVGSPSGSLHGLKVLDLSRVLAILADYGAEIIKIEAIGKGFLTDRETRCGPQDDTRHFKMRGEDQAWKTGAGPMSNYFSSVNRNKKSVTLDIKNPRGKEIFVELLKQADVLVENFKPGTMDRLGLGYELLREQNPRLIYASISGYGTSGPYAKRGGYDPIAGAEAGLIHVTGEQNGPPVRPGIGMVDLATGLYLHGAILAALHARERGGMGQRVDASLFETQVSLLTNVGLAWLNLGIEAQRWGCQHSSIVPYNAFKTKDKYLVGGATNDAQFAGLCRLLGLETLIDDERFATNPKRVENRHLINPIFNAAFGTKTADEWMQLIGETTLPFAPINNMESTFTHPQIEARGMIAEMETDTAASGQIRVIGPAVKFSETSPSLRAPPPALGQHTVEVLGTLGIDAKEVDQLRENGVV
ncbi:putative Succinate--hydroxymethylglutarate CoA-transferase [Seiridium unicorne]|uniref:Succinate--hydroxymethylglutarate CoA-transferase n=1 Tax=Seiridium unicorne TaxID=138068 RepID=A0ABR2UW63_9PEZI